MARCNDSTCNCKIEGGAGVAVEGGGTPASPYRISVDQAGQISVVDTSTIDLALSPQSETDQAELSATLTAVLGDLEDVAAGVPTNGYVLAWTGTQWAPVPPATAAPGAVAVGVGLTGDGSSAAPLHAVADPNGGLTVGTLGMAMSQATKDRLTHLETVRFDPQYLRCERSDPMTVTDSSWTRPQNYDLGITHQVGTRLTHDSTGYTTVLDAGVYVWEATCVWEQLAAQTSPPSMSVSIQKNDVTTKYGAQSDVLPADDVIGAHRVSYSGSVPCAANDKLRPAYYQNNPANASMQVIPESFTVYRIA